MFIIMFPNYTDGDGETLFPFHHNVGHVCTITFTNTCHKNLYKFPNHKRVGARSWVHFKVDKWNYFP